MNIIFSCEKTISSVKMKSSQDILETLRAGDICLPPLEIRLAGIEPGVPDRPDAYVDIRWGDRTLRMVALIRSSFSKRALAEAVVEIRRYAAERDMLPLLLATYLQPARLEELLRAEVSGVDLSGNGVVVAPGEMLVMRTGEVNRYPADRRVRNVYAGVSSLVSRVFLLRPQYESVRAVRQEVLDRGGAVSLATVSKVLRRLDEDLIIRRVGRTSELLYPNELLGHLAAGYRPPDIRRRRMFRWSGADSLRDALAAAGEGLVVTGAASVERYANMARERVLRCYCRSLSSLERTLADKLDETARFPDLELLETDDPTVYFDKRRFDGLAYASPIQAWLELQAGDSRQAATAGAIRQSLVDEVQAGLDR